MSKTSKSKSILGKKSPKVAARKAIAPKAKTRAEGRRVVRPKQAPKPAQKGPTTEPPAVEKEPTRPAESATTSASAAPSTSAPATEVPRPKASSRMRRSPGERDPRLPAIGTTIERLYKGEALRVEVLDEGFRFKGAFYSSLSALAKSFTGCATNGFLWFGLAQRPERPAATEQA